MDEKIGIRDIEDICKKYSVRIKQIEAVKSGSSNRNYVIKGESGNYILKCMPKDCFPPDFAGFQQYLSEILIENKIPFTPNLTVNENYVYEDESHYWQMRPFISGISEMDMDDHDQIALSAKTLALIHRIKTQSEDKRVFVFSKYREKTKEKLEGLFTVISSYLGNDEAKEMTSLYEKILNMNEVIKLSDHSFSSGIIHGDYHAGNIFFKHRDLVQIIDWDTAEINPKIFDFAKSIYLLTRVGHGYFENDLKKLRIFYKNYIDEIELSKEELLAVPFVVMVNYIPETDYIKTFTDEKKILWYLRWTYDAALSAGNQFYDKYMRIIYE